MNNKYDIRDFVPVLTEQSVSEDLIKRFKKRRKESGFSQLELSKRSGVSYGSIRRFESIGEISLTSLIKISSAIGCLEEFSNLFTTPIVKNLKDMK
ncbi:MAG: helix-turn-helix transcriptional regulator [Bacilli bacterium]